MKLSSCVLLPDSNVKLLAYRGTDMESSFRDLKEIGYDGVELFIRDPAALDLPLLNRLLEQYKLEVCAIGTAAISAQDKITLCNLDRDKQRAAIERVKKLVDVSVGHGRVPVCIGKFRGNLNPDKRIDGWRILRESFIEICEYAAKQNVKIALEPQERGNLNNLNSTRDGDMWIEQIGAPNRGLLLDTFHMNLVDESLSFGVVQGAKYLCHVHASDSGRKAPGLGDIDFHEVVNALRAVGYNGYLSVEIAQPPDALGAAKKSLETLSNIISMY